MPNNTIKYVAKTLGKSIKEIETIWDNAKAKIEKEYNTEDNYALIMVIFKKMLGDVALDKLDWDKLEESCDINEPAINGSDYPKNLKSGISFKDYIEKIN